MSFTGVFATGISALTAFSEGIAGISTNIANSQTVGFREVETRFSDLVPTGARDTAGAIGGGTIGGGVSAANVRIADAQGGITRTDEPTNLAIAGEGFFAVSPATGAIGGADNPVFFTRAGGFTPNTDGVLQNAAGFFLLGRPVAGAGSVITDSLAGLEAVDINRIPSGADAEALGPVSSVSIDSEGNLSATYSNGEARVLYRIPLALFRNPAGLDPSGENTFLTTDVSGAARLVGPGSGIAGVLESSAVEQSTVDIGEAFSALIETQRAYATGARTISVADELWQRLIETAA